MLEQYFEEWEGNKKQEDGERAVKYSVPDTISAGCGSL